MLRVYCISLAGACHQHWNFLSCMYGFAAFSDMYLFFAKQFSDTWLPADKLKCNTSCSLWLLWHLLPSLT